MSHKLKVESRTQLKNKFNKLSKTGLIPAAIYGFKGNFNIQLNQDKFQRLLSEAGTTSVVELDLDGTNHNCYIQEVQINPVTRLPIHVSFREVNLKVEITAEIPFELQGEAESLAVKEENSIIILAKNTVELRGLPTDIPQKIEIDVSGFHAGDTVLLKDIKLPEGVSVVHQEELEETVATTASAIQEEIIEDVNQAIAEANAAAETTGVEAEGSPSENPEPKEEKKE